MSSDRRRLKENLRRVHQRIADACARARRDPATVRFVAVTKTVEPDVIRMAMDLGIQDLGENRIQQLTRRAAMIEESLSRIPPDQLAPSPRWHMVGRLQRNKVKAAIEVADTIHSVDSLRLAEEISRRAHALGKQMPCLLQVNASGEGSKAGVPVAAAPYLAEQIVSLPGMRLTGLMTMGPLTEDLERVRIGFTAVRELFEEMQAQRTCGPAFSELSMGMSNDFEIAVEEGATLLRIGRALFEGLQSQT